MGATISAAQVASQSDASSYRAVQLLATTITEAQVQKFVRATRDSFSLTLEDTLALAPNARIEDVQQAYQALALSDRAIVNSHEVLGLLILLSPHLSSDQKLRGLFQMFNVSLHRSGELVGDEAIMLFRTIARGLLKIIRSSSGAVQSRSAFENLTKTVFADKETLRLDEFIEACRSSHQIMSFAGHWLEQDEHSNDAARTLEATES